MPPPTKQTRAASAAPAPAPAARASASRSAAAPAAAKRQRAGKPAVRLSDKPQRPRGGGSRAEAEAAAEPKESQDPRLKKALDKVKSNAKGLKKHPAAADKAAEAQDAATPPPNAKLADAQAEKVGEMQEAEGQKPDKNSFAELLKKEIEKVLPKNVEAADDYLNKDETDKLKATASGNIEAQKQSATSGLKTATETAPDTSVIPDKEVKPLPPEALPPAVVPPVGARDAMPAPQPDEEVSLQGSKDEVNQKLASNKITPEQLQKANDPRFTAALAAKQSVDKNADAAPGKYRVSEQKTIADAASRAVSDERRQVAQMKDVHGKSGAAVKDRQASAKGQDETRRKEVADNIEKIFSETKKNVEGKLSTLEADVTSMFDTGLDDALKDMRKYISTEKKNWKEDRYGSFPLFNAVLWGYDKLKGIDKVPGIKKIYVDANEKFLRDLGVVVDNIATYVESQLKAAKDEVAAGQKRIADYVASLPKDLQEFGRAAEHEISGRFDELRQGIEDKKNDLAQNLAQRYKEAREKAAEAINEMRAEDKGLVTAFIEKIGEIIEILRKFRDRVMGLLKKAAATIDLIVSDPIGFLKNLLAAVKQGLNQFVNNIWEHLKAGFMGWLFGALGGIGITLPKDFSLPSILSLVLQVLGLTPERIRARVVKFIGERNMAIIEAVWEAVKILIDGGPAALWEKIKEYLGNLKDMLVEAIQEWVVSKIIQAAVTKLVSMFNPVGAIIQAIMVIYNTVMFFIERINQILEFVEAVVNSVDKIARGSIGDAASWIEKALARTIPVIISFLARLLGLGGISDKVKGFILKLQTKVENALDKIIEKILGGIKKVFGAVVGAGKTLVSKFVQWWKKRRVFTTETGHRHTLFFQGEAESARLVMSSNIAESIEDKIAARRTASRNGTKPLDANQRKSLTQAEETYGKLESIMRALRKTQIDSTDSAKQAAATQKASDEMDILLADLEKQLIAGDIDTTNEEGEALPPTKVIFNMDQGRAGNVVANPLTAIPGNTAGSAAQGDIKGWELMPDIDWDVLNTKTGQEGPKYWVKMHLLSYRFHGPGTKWNLVPALGVVNTGWVLKQVEEPVSTLVHDEKRTLSFEANAQYAHSDPKVKNFPSHVEFKWQTIDGKKKGPLRTKGDNLKPPVFLGKGVTAKPDLNTASRDMLQLRAGLPQDLARVIVVERQNGQFTVKSNFERRMRDAIKDKFPDRTFGQYLPDLRANADKFVLNGDQIY